MGHNKYDLCRKLEELYQINLSFAGELVTQVMQWEAKDWLHEEGGIPSQLELGHFWLNQWQNYVLTSREAAEPQPYLKIAEVPKGVEVFHPEIISAAILYGRLLYGKERVSREIRLPEKLSRYVSADNFALLEEDNGRWRKFKENNSPVIAVKIKNGEDGEKLFQAGKFPREEIEGYSQ